MDARSCIICSTPFTPQRGNARACGKKCARVVAKNRLARYHIERHGITAIPSQCKQCQQEFIAHQKTQKFCSTKCSAEHRTSVLKVEYQTPEGKERAQARALKSYLKNKGGRSEVMKAKRQEHPEIRLIGNIRTRTRHALKGTAKSAPTLSLLGCSPADLRAWLEKQFKPGMNWENYGLTGWHIDHRRPLASFALIKADGLLDQVELGRAMHFTNLQPLWYWENIAKSDKLISV